MTASSSSEPSGLTVDGIPVPQTVEAEGVRAVEQYVAEHRAIADITAPAVIETAPNPPTNSEGAE